MAQGPDGCDRHGAWRDCQGVNEVPLAALTIDGVTPRCSGSKAKRYRAREWRVLTTGSFVTCCGSSPVLRIGTGWD